MEVSNDLYQEQVLSYTPHRTATGLLLMFLGILGSAIATTANSINALSHPSLEALLNQQTPLWLTVANCLAPIALVLEVIGLFMIASEAGKLSREHHRLAWLAVILYVVSFVMTIVINIPLSYMVSLQGNLQLAYVSLAVTAFGTVLGVVGMCLLVYYLLDPDLRRPALILAAFYSIAVLTMHAVSLSNYHLYEMKVQNITMYLPIPYNGGAYPIMLILTVLCEWVFAGLYLFAALHWRKRVQDAVVDGVV